MRLPERLAFGGYLLALLLTACAAPPVPPSVAEVLDAHPTHTALPIPTRSLPPATATSAPTLVASETATPAPPTASATLTPLPATATPTEVPSVHLRAVGDIMLARSIGDRIGSNGPDVPFRSVLDALAAADLLAGNLECVISDVGVPEPKAYVFRAPPAAAESLQLAGFDILSLANNHAMDYGADSLFDTMARLQDVGIAFVGAGSDKAAARGAVMLTRNGLTVAFLAYVDVPVEGRSGFDTRRWIAGPQAPGVAWADLEHIAEDVAAARVQADVVVVMMHFGLEGRREPTAAQRQQARTAIDAGAALVLGAHSHMLQPIEEYRGGVIAYSLGNFVFDGFSWPANYSAIFEATLTQAGVESYGWIPVVIEHGLPRMATGSEALEILSMVPTE
jgi:poly-gamma-glutamate capsule biosynthesis protein CapA/YwtB (metallophosphatase superfamily)